MRYIHSMEYFLAIKRNEVLIHATAHCTHCAKLKEIVTKDHILSPSMMSSIQNRQMYKDRRASQVVLVVKNLPASEMWV